eukprot:TRINITY_DN5406_c0_g1_i1.p1 TRINITY_DN5406_c0_g1~~TRINITY_DN5406_c0_g1_i1.p1  ORF type:complete len:172 (+),score=54.08 TRINITY_DN5406_c0_g1_i1:76-516(+)
MTATNKEVLDISIKCTPQEAHQGFLQHVWIGGGGLGPIPPGIVKEGDSVTRQGCIRRVPGCINEEILESNLGSSPKIVYRIASGPFPVRYHRGTVLFLDDGSGGTKVNWTCDYTPMCGFGLMLRYLIRITFGIMLRHLKSRIESKL